MGIDLQWRGKEKQGNGMVERRTVSHGRATARRSDEAQRLGSGQHRNATERLHFAWRREAKASRSIATEKIGIALPRKGSAQTSKSKTRDAMRMQGEE